MGEPKLSKIASRLCAIGGNYSFGRFPIPAEHVFLATNLSYAFVNLKPVIPGHVLLAPRRRVEVRCTIPPGVFTACLCWYYI